MPRPRLATALALSLMLSAAGTAIGADDAASDRYLLAETGKGVMRLDRTDGSVSFCRLSGEDFVCTAAIDDRQALEDEIERLKSENARLRARLAALRERGPDYRGDELPSDEEIEQMMDRTEKMMRRFFGIVDSLRREYEDGSTL